MGKWDTGDLRNYAEYNASDYRGIDFVRELEQFTQFCCETIVYCNEADNMTKDAQQAFRSPLEKKGNAIFILDGNDETGFIEPIKSRCLIFRFEPLSYTEIYMRLLYIIKAEGMQVNEQVQNVAKELAEQANGDMRQAISSLEAFIP